MKLFVEQSTTVPTRMAEEQTIPEFNKVDQVLADELEAAFKTGQPAQTTAKNIWTVWEKSLADATAPKRAPSGSAGGPATSGA